MTQGIFVSYRYADSSSAAHRLYDALKADYANVFIDQHGIRSGEDFRTAIRQTLAQCDVVLVVIAKRWLEPSLAEALPRRIDSDEDWVRFEVVESLRTQKYVVPVLVEDASLPNPAELPDDLQSLCHKNPQRLITHEFAMGVAELAKDIETYRADNARNARKLGQLHEWDQSFLVENSDGTGGIQLTQIDSRTFRLGSSIRYIGAATGLEGRVSSAVLDYIRLVDPTRLESTQLAATPGPLRGLVNSYGLHTPATLLYAWLVQKAPPLPGLDQPAKDRYLRFMLADLQVPLQQRWLMFSAVTMRTRWVAGGIQRIGLTLWVLAVLASTAGLVVGTTSTPQLAWPSMLVFVLSAAFWGRQFGGASDFGVGSRVEE